jgi:diacylglycerol kinase family enzyme
VDGPGAEFTARLGRAPNAIRRSRVTRLTTARPRARASWVLLEGGRATTVTVPAFVNPAAHSAKAALEALAHFPGFQVRQTSPLQLEMALQEAVRAGEPRVLVAGGDGTLATAASVLAGSSTALAVLPAGNLNHFARNHAIPGDPGRALKLAERGRIGLVDVGYVNGQLFLNTSSVGVYVRFLETRDRLQSYLGYWLASALAGLWMLRSTRLMRVTLEAEREQRVYHARLVFVGVGERMLAPPGLGQLAGEPGGALHVVVPRGRRQARRFARAFAGWDRGSPVEAKPFGLDSALVQRFRLDLPRTSIKLAMDGEIRRQRTPLEYRLEPAALRVVLPDRAD